MMLALSQGLMAPLTPVNTRSLSHITMQSYTEYLASRQRSAASVLVVTDGYAEYMAKRNAVATVPVVENLVPTPEVPVAVWQRVATLSTLPNVMAGHRCSRRMTVDLLST